LHGADETVIRCGNENTPSRTTATLQGIGAGLGYTTVTTIGINMAIAFDTFSID
jgi:hypothetical protein